MNKLTKAEEKQVNRLLAKEFIERLGYEPTKRRINNFIKNIIDFETREKKARIATNMLIS